MLAEFRLQLQQPRGDRNRLMLKLVARIDEQRGVDVSEHSESERLLILLALRENARNASDAKLPQSIQLQNLYFALATALPPARLTDLFKRGTHTFEGACETALLLRFPAGQLSWVRDGLPRRTLLQVSHRDALKLVWRAARHLKGFAPAYFTHANGFRHNRFTMVELEARRSYVRMASAMRGEPDVLGIVTISWYHDPDLIRVSPHLAWMNGIVEEGGGVVIAGGPATTDSGTFENSASRREAAATGDYVPREGIVLWPRAQLLRWADRQNDVDDDAPMLKRLHKMLNSAGVV